jgi:hypothetical protein
MEHLLEAIPQMRYTPGLSLAVLFTILAPLSALPKIVAELLPPPREVLTAPTPEQYQKELQRILQERHKAAKAIFARAAIADTDDQLFINDAKELLTVELQLARTEAEKVAAHRAHIQRIDERIALIKKIMNFAATPMYVERMNVDAFGQTRFWSGFAPGQNQNARLSRDDHIDRLNLHKTKAQEELLKQMLTLPPQK